jgi:hypothetical protein
MHAYAVGARTYDPMRLSVSGKLLFLISLSCAKGSLNSDSARLCQIYITIR